jgi:hypothetical protein
MLTRLRKKRWLRGRNFTISVLEPEESSSFEGFFDSLEERDQNELDALLERMADHGPILNEQKSRQLSDDIYEFKTRNVRVFWFYETGRVVILSHGKMKNDLTKKRRYREEVERAKMLRHQWRKQQEGK